MDLEQLSQQLPKPLLAAGAIFLAIIIFMILNPPHTICDTQTENLKQNQTGILFPQKVGKRTYPGRIQKAMESCSFGNSSGACYEYFNILRRVAVSIKNGSRECIPEMLTVRIESYAKMEIYESVQVGGQKKEELSSIRYDTVPLSKVLEEGLTMMVQKAWGEAPPEPGISRFGWMRETEMAVFCHLQDVIRRGRGEKSFGELQIEVMKKLPGEKQRPPEGGVTFPPPRPAPQVFSEAQIRARSLFSVNCGAYR